MTVIIQFIRSINVVWQVIGHGKVFPIRIEVFGVMNNTQQGINTVEVLAISVIEQDDDVYVHNCCLGD